MVPLVLDRLVLIVSAFSISVSADTMNCGLVPIFRFLFSAFVSIWHLNDKKNLFGY